MANDKQDEIIRAYAILQALRKNIAQIGVVPEKYVDEYHSAIDKIELLGINCSEFRIPDSEVRPQPGPSAYFAGKQIWSSEGITGVERSFILSKLDAILGYFEIITAEKPRKMGFRKPNDD